MSSEIKPGVETSEYTAMQNSAWWGKAMIILGVLSTTISGVVEGIREYQQAAGSEVVGSKLGAALGIFGITLAMIGGIKKALTEAAYISGRSLVKAAALRDDAPPPKV